MDMDTKYPSLWDLKRRAQKRIPHFVWEYLDSGTGREQGDHRNRDRLAQILLKTAVLEGEIQVDLTTNFLGQDYDLPFGIAPVGMSGAIWPGAERMLAKLGKARNIPFGLSTMACKAPEDIAGEFGTNGWFQLYPPAEEDILRDMLDRVRQGGFTTLVLTVDVPSQSRRERQTRGGLTHPPAITPRTLLHTATCPAWAVGTLREGFPQLPFIGKYSTHKGPLPSTAHIGYMLRVAPDWDYFRRLRDMWKGPLLVKGILEPEDALACVKEGADAVWISNHAARQFEASRACIDCVVPIRAAVGPDYPLIFDSGVMGGLDILRAIALGADFVMLGKAFHYGLGAAGYAGADHAVNILRDDLIANMGQMGISRVNDARNCLLD
jgi:L-lactate dehydrogenase (cytochrome)